MRSWLMWQTKTRCQVQERQGYFNKYSLTKAKVMKSHNDDEMMKNHNEKDLDQDPKTRRDTGQNKNQNKS